MIKQGFPPIIDDNTKILVLGTMPGDKSIRTGEYYANSTNQFWKMIFHVFNSGVSVFDYEEKTKLLLNNSIGLWDVLSKAERNGSLDSNILKEEYNDFQHFFKTYPNIKTVIFNGKKPAEYFKANNILFEHKEYHILPSTSSANTTKFDIKLKDWKAVLSKYSGK
jgi:hypoxanthine-DNA glycosylase